MKRLTKYQKKLADKAVDTLKKLQDLGVEVMVIDGGGGNSGLTFWRPTEDERFLAYDIVSHVDAAQYNEFYDKSYEPLSSTGLRIDCIAP